MFQNSNYISNFERRLYKELFILREDKIKDIIEEKWNFTHSV